MCSFIGEPQIYKHFFKKLILKTYKRLSQLAQRGICVQKTSVYKRYNSKTIFPYGAEAYILKYTIQNKAHLKEPGNKTKKNF